MLFKITFATTPVSAGVYPVEKKNAENRIKYFKASYPTVCQWDEVCP